jgi:hypothetical protein
MNHFVAFAGDFKDAEAELAQKKEFGGDYVPREIREFVTEGLQKAGFSIQTRSEKPVLDLSCPLEEHAWTIMVGLTDEHQGKPVWSIELMRKTGMVERLRGNIDSREEGPLVDAIHDLLSKDSRVKQIRWFKDSDASPSLGLFEEEVRCANTPWDELSHLGAKPVERFQQFIDGYGRSLRYIIVGSILLSFVLGKIGWGLLLMSLGLWFAMIGVMMVWACLIGIKKALRNPVKGDYTVILNSFCALLGGVLTVAGLVMVLRMASDCLTEITKWQ